MPRTAHFHTSGRLAPVDVARLRLCLPFQCSPEALNLLAWLATGGGFELTTDAERLEIVLFDVERLLSETLNFSPCKELVLDGWVPVAGCGRRGRSIYLVQLGGEGLGQVRRYRPDALRTAESIVGSDLEWVHPSLEELLARATVRPDLRLRRRLPRGPGAPSLAKAPRTTPSLSRAERGQRRLLERNLSLF